MSLVTMLVLLTVVSWLFWLVACGCVRFFSRQSHRPSEYAPPVSILKPVCGVDYDAYRNFASFCQQDYPAFELLFGVQDANDPSLPILDRLRRDFPHIPIQVVRSEPLGTNAKVSNLHALASAAQYDVLVMSDSDMRVSPDYLRKVVAPLADEGVGLVTCLYRGHEATSWAARFGALYFSTTYMPSALVAALLLHMPVAFGSTIVVRRRELDRIGGFQAIADHLADDYELAARISALGRKVVVAPYVVANMLGPESWRQVWQRELRWVRCIRASRPLEYPGLLLTFSLPLAIATAIASEFDVLGRNIVVATLFVRWLVGWLIAAYTDDAFTRSLLPWLPLRDLMTFAMWFRGLIGRSVQWRGALFDVDHDGLLAPLPGGTAEQRAGDVREMGLPTSSRRNHSP